METNEVKQAHKEKIPFVFFFLWLAQWGFDLLKSEFPDLHAYNGASQRGTQHALVPGQS